MQEEFMGMPAMSAGEMTMSAFPPVTPVGMCYVPMQKFTQVYEPETGWKQGTIFPDLDKPWLGGRGTPR